MILIKLGCRVGPELTGELTNEGDNVGADDWRTDEAGR